MATTFPSASNRSSVPTFTPASSSPLAVITPRRSYQTAGPERVYWLGALTNAVARVCSAGSPVSIQRYSTAYLPIPVSSAAKPM